MFISANFSPERACVILLEVMLQEEGAGVDRSFPVDSASGQQMDKIGQEPIPEFSHIMLQNPYINRKQEQFISIDTKIENRHNLHIIIGNIAPYSMDCLNGSMSATGQAHCKMSL